MSDCAELGHEWASDHENDPPVCIHCGAAAPVWKGLGYATADDFKRRDKDWRAEAERLRQALENAKDALYDAWEGSGDATDLAAYTMARLALEDVE